MMPADGQEIGLGIQVSCDTRQMTNDSELDDTSIEEMRDGMPVMI